MTRPEKRDGKGGRALFIGRFQPLHNGHLRVIKNILRANEKITIVIGGPAKPNARNPFSFAERERMIKASLDSEGISGYDLRRLADVNDDDQWARGIMKMGKFDVAYSRNPWVLRCLKMAGITTRKHAFYQRYKNCGRVIRARIASGKEWKSLVPPAVYEWINKRHSPGVD